MKKNLLINGETEHIEIIKLIPNKTIILDTGDGQVEFEVIKAFKDLGLFILKSNNQLYRCHFDKKNGYLTGHLELNIKSGAYNNLNSDTAKNVKPNNQNIIYSPLSGIVREVNCSSGSNLQLDDLIVKIEAMKMQLPILSHRSGVIEKVYVEVGAEIMEGDEIVIFV